MRLCGGATALLIGLIAPSCDAGPVTYEVLFEATWSPATHPDAYPPNAHFSPLIGATHNSQVSFWSVGQLATLGIEQMAELGGTSLLKSEIQLALDSGSAAAILQGSGISSPGQTSLTFNIEESHSLVTLVTMVAPSPDWFVGISGLELRPGGHWAQAISIDLLAYDAGTDSGVDFGSANLDTNPRQPISLLGAPLEGTPALGTLSLRLTSIPEPGSLPLAISALLMSVAGLARRYLGRTHCS